MPGISANTRTLSAYAADLLQYARWIIEREVDFTDCQQRSHYDESMPACVECRFGSACRWLDQHRTPDMETASMEEMIAGIESASEYLQSTMRNSDTNDPELHDWFHKAHRFLRAQGE